MRIPHLNYFCYCNKTSKNFFNYEGILNKSFVDKFHLFLRKKKGESENIMDEKFKRDLARGKEGELIVLDALAQLTDGYTFEHIGEIPAYYYKGDIKAIDKKTGEEYFIEVKNDGCIATTQNVLFEEAVYYYKYEYLADGFMYRPYQYYCVLSEANRTLYIFDFEILKKNYKKGIFKNLKYKSQESDCYLCQLCDIKSWGALLYELNY